MTARTWMAECTALFLRTVDGLTEDVLAAPSLLPGWSRKHVLAHVHHNAEAMCRLVSWATTGVETPMYPSAEHRDAEIEKSATLPGDELRRLARESAAVLADDLDRLSDDQRSRQIAIRGRLFPASELPWLRAREVAVHTVDLGAGVGFPDLPEDLVARLVRDVVDKRLGEGEGPLLAGWLTGRDSQPQVLGRWL